MGSNEMTLLKDAPATVATVGRYYTDKTRRLQFLCVPVVPAEAAALAAVIPGYNGYRGEEVADALAELGEIPAPLTVSFGREFSPVVYVRFGTDRPTVQLVHQVKAILAKAQPDELDYNPKDHTLRAWWD